MNLMCNREKEPVSMWNQGSPSYLGLESNLRYFHNSLQIYEQFLTKTFLEVAHTLVVVMFYPLISVYFNNRTKLTIGDDESYALYFNLIDFLPIIYTYLCH